MTARIQTQLVAKRLHQAALEIYIAQLDKLGLGSQQDADLSRLAADCLRAARALISAEQGEP